jgi:hypothetical protein
MRTVQIRYGGSHLANIYEFEIHIYVYVEQRQYLHIHLTPFVLQPYCRLISEKRQLQSREAKNIEFIVVFLSPSM